MTEEGGDRELAKENTRGKWDKRKKEENYKESRLVVVAEGRTWTGGGMEEWRG